MATKKHVIHLYLLTDLNPPAKVFDSFDWRTVAGCMKNRVYLGCQEIEIDWPEVDENNLVIDALKADIEKERADSQVRVNLLMERISKLQAIGYEAAK